MSDQVEEQVRISLEAIRDAQTQPGERDAQALIRLAQRVQGSATGSTDKERRVFLNAVGERLMAEAGPSEVRKLPGLVGKHRVFDDPNGQTVHDFGTLLTMMAKRR